MADAGLISSTAAAADGPQVVDGKLTMGLLAGGGGASTCTGGD